MKKMLKLVKGTKREDKNGTGTGSADELDDDADGAAYCYKIDSEAEDKMSRLHRAAWHGSLEKVKSLLQKKAGDVNAVDSFDRTPLHLAVAKGYYNIAWVLLNHNAGLGHVDCDGYTPFLKAVECGQKECVHLMLERGADVTCTDTNKNSALHLAAKQGSFTIISMLLKKGININAQNALGESVLHVACAAENRDLIEFILDNGASINIADKKGRTPLMVVAKLGNMSIVDLLLERGSQLDACDVNGLSVKDYASREGHSKVVNQLSMQKMSVMARTRSQENVLDDVDGLDTAQTREINENSNDHKTVKAQFTEEKLTKSNDEKSKDEKQSSSIENDSTKCKEVQNEKDNVITSSLIKNDYELNVTDVNEKEIQNVASDSKIVCADELVIKKIVTENDQNVNSIGSVEINNSSEKPNEVTEKSKEIMENKDKSINVLQNKDEESVSQCTMPPPMGPPRSWDFIQTSIMQSTDVNEMTEKKTTENIEQIPEPIVGEVNTDDSELEWGSDESLPTDPNQMASNVVDILKEGNKKKSTFYNFITTKLMSKNKNRVSASADSVINSDTTTKKHVRNKSFSSLNTFKLTVPSDVDKALHHLSPEMNFAHSSFSKSKSFNEHIKNIDKNAVEFERSKSLCLELKHNKNTSENQQRDSDSQSDDSSLRSKRSLLLSMRMPKVHDEQHNDYYMGAKDSETSEDEGPHYWYSPSKKSDKIVQQDTVIRNNSDSEDSESDKVIEAMIKSTPISTSKEQKFSDDSDPENLVSFSTNREDHRTHKKTSHISNRIRSFNGFLKRITDDKDKLQVELCGYKELSQLLKYQKNKLKEDIASRNETTKRLEEQLDLLDNKYLEALNKIQALELSSTNLDKENQYLKEINSNLMIKMNKSTSSSISKPVEELSKFEMGDQSSDSKAEDSKMFITKLQEQLKVEQDKRLELDERVKSLAEEISAHQCHGSTVDLLNELQYRIKKDYVPRKEVLELKNEQERKLNEVKMESEKKLADKFHDLNNLLSQQIEQQEKLEMQREKIEKQLKQEFENTRQRFQLEIAKLQTTLKTKEMEEQILRERCDVYSQAIEKSQDISWKKLMDKAHPGPGVSFKRPFVPPSSEMYSSTHCKTPEPSPTLTNTDPVENFYNKYFHCKDPAPRNKLLDKIIVQNKNAALEGEELFDN